MGTGPGDLGLLEGGAGPGDAQEGLGASLLADGRDLMLPPNPSANFFSQVPSWSNFGFVNSRERCPLDSFEDIAYHFCHRYYSLLDSDASNMYSLYSRDGQASKIDLSGKRQVAVGHGEIRNFYSQFAAVKTSANLTSVQVSCIGANAALLLVAISGTLSKTLRGREQVYRLSQAVVLGGDFWRSRFHILNDLSIEEPVDSGDFASGSRGGALESPSDASLPFTSHRTSALPFAASQVDAGALGIEGNLADPSGGALTCSRGLGAFREPPLPFTSTPVEDRPIDGALAKCVTPGCRGGALDSSLGPAGADLGAATCLGAVGASREPLGKFGESGRALDVAAIRGRPPENPSTVLAEPLGATTANTASAKGAKSKPPTIATATAGKRDHNPKSGATDCQNWRLVIPRVPSGVSEHELTLHLSRHVSSVGGLVSVNLRAAYTSANPSVSALGAAGEKTRFALVTVDSNEAYKVLSTASVTIAGRKLHLEPYKAKLAQKEAPQHPQHSGKRLGASGKAGNAASAASAASAAGGNTSATRLGAGASTAAAAGQGRLHAGARS